MAPRTLPRRAVGRTLATVRSLRVSSSAVRRLLGFFVCGLFAVGLLLTFAAGKGEAQAGGAGSSGYAYARAPKVDTVNTVNASATRSSDSSSAKPFVIGGGAVLIGAGAVLEAKFARRRPH
jgi:hypothetical protein